MSIELPDKETHRAAWAGLAMADRRRIMKYVNRGEVVEDRRDAVLAIGAAEQQKNFWKWTWGLGPMLGLVLIGRPVLEIVFNVVLSTGLIIGLSRWRWVRADRCQQACIELLEGPRRKQRSTKSREGHLPTDPDRAPSTPAASRGPQPSPAEWSGDRPDPNTSKAKLKRRKKRR